MLWWEEILMERLGSKILDKRSLKNCFRSARHPSIIAPLGP
jgi:hypothetical protein